MEGKGGAAYLTAEEVAVLTGYSVATVRAKFADGSLPGYRLGRGPWRAVEGEIRAAMQGRRVVVGGDRREARDVIREAMQAGLRKAALRVARQGA